MMLILITSCKNNKDLRNALRNTWLKNSPFPYFFIIGDSESTYVNEDVLYVSANDDYISVAKKQLEAFKYCFNNFNIDHLFICDDDAYVRLDLLLDFDYKNFDYCGCGPVRMWDVPYYVAGGSGIILSKKAIKTIIENGNEYIDCPIYDSVAKTNLAKKENCFWGDRFIGLTLSNSDIKPKYVGEFVETSLNPLSDSPKPYNNIIAYHVSNIGNNKTKPLTAEDIFKIYNELNTDLKPIRVAMIINQWSMGGAEKEFADMILDANSDKIQFVGIALRSAFEYCVSKKYKNILPEFHCGPCHYEQAIDNDLILHDSFEEAINTVAAEADVIIKWHVDNEYLENIGKPSILISNASSWYTEKTYQKVKADKYIANSIWSSDWFPKHAQGKIDVIYSGHDLKRIQPLKNKDQFKKELGFSENDKIISHIGRINLNKNLETLIKSIKVLENDWKLLLVGHVCSTQSKEFWELIKKEIPGRYKVLPWTENIGDAFNITDVFVLSSFYEGFSNALAEAWMSKTPTVFSRCGSAKELIKEYGNIGIDVPTNVTIKDLAKAIEKAIKNKDGVKNAFDMIKNFTKEKSARKWERCITEVCYNRPRMKIGLLMPNLSFGGQERLVECLSKYSSKGSVEYYFFKPKGCNIKSEIYTVCNLSKFMELHIEKTEPKLFEEAKNLNLKNVYFYDDCKNMMKKANEMDVILTWGIENLEELSNNLSVPIIMLSICADKWNQDIIAKNYKLGSEYVAICNSANIFPESIQNNICKIGNILPHELKKITIEKSELKKSLGIKKEDILVGLVGRWDYQKNPLALARAISKLPSNYKAVYIGTDWRYKYFKDIEIGKDPSKLTYEQELNKILDPDRYILIPPQTEVFNYYNILDVIMVPSRNEGFGFNIIETWMMKKPLVCTNVGIYKEFKNNFINHGITINHDDDGEKLAIAIKDALEISQEELNTTKNKCFENFNACKLTKKWLEFFNLTIEKHKFKIKKETCLNIEDIDYKSKIKSLIEKGKKPKKIARQLNIEKFPVPNNEKEWTYILVKKFI